MSRAAGLLELLAPSLLGTALAVALLALVTVPQRRAQRPAAAGVLTLHLLSDGGLRAWNRRLGEADLAALLRAAEGRAGPQPRLRLIPHPSLPWGVVRERLEQLERVGLSLELQLP
ncbi:MAG: hypothetical protein ACK522_05785 [Synechococcaceae cyanobacterium]